MRFISFDAEDGVGLGLVLDSDRFVDLAPIAPDLRGSMRRLCALSPEERQARFGHIDPCWPVRPMASVRLLPPVPDPGAVWALALNFASHIAEGGHQRPEYPMLFLRLPASFVGHGEPLLKPDGTQQFDYEGELAVVIGKAGRSIPVESAMDHVAGYCCNNEGSVREWQKHTSQILPGKNFEASGSLGPWLVTADEFGDPYSHRLTTRLNGQEVQNAMLGEMLFSIAEMIAYVSQIATLHPGDTLLMGTPGGVGFRRQPQLFLWPGDEVEVEIEGLGVLRNAVVQRADD